MRVTSPIRRWQQMCVWALFGLAVPTLVIAKTDTAAPLTKPAQASTTPAPKAKQSSSENATIKQPTGKQPLSHASSHPSSSHPSAQKSKTSRGKKVAGKRGQQAIDSARSREIQTALIREQYLQGQPTGTWDSTSQAAMQRYQADHGWQSRTTPDARALIKLGLGPSQDHLLNPESAMTATNASADAHSGSGHATAPDSKTPAKPTPADGSPQP